jgi:hypothetical protein
LEKKKRVILVEELVDVEDLRLDHRGDRGKIRYTLNNGRRPSGCERSIEKERAA